MAPSSYAPVPPTYIEVGHDPDGETAVWETGSIVSLAQIVVSTPETIE